MLASRSLAQPSTLRMKSRRQPGLSGGSRDASNRSATSSPEQSFTPAVVDLNTNIFTLGVGYARPRWSVDLAYRLILGLDRNIDDSINSPPGEYGDTAHAFVITATIKL